MLLFENPEDLGAVQQGSLYGQRPASMWQWPTFFELLEKQGWETVAFYQADFGTEYLKPTRLLLKGFQTQQQTAFVQGRPSFDEQGFYEGPLTKREAVKQLIGHAGNSFATKGTEQWPSELCRWIAFANFGEISHLSRFGLRRGSTKYHNNFGKVYNHRTRRLEDTWGKR